MANGDEDEECRRYGYRSTHIVNDYCHLAWSGNVAIREGKPSQ